MFQCNAAQIAVLPGFCQYFGLHMVYSVVIYLNMTRYNTEINKKNYVKKDSKQENKKDGNSHVTLETSPCVRPGQKGKN